MSRCRPYTISGTINAPGVVDNMGLTVFATSVTDEASAIAYTDCGGALHDPPARQGQLHHQGRTAE